MKYLVLALVAIMCVAMVGVMGDPPMNAGDTLDTSNYSGAGLMVINNNGGGGYGGADWVDQNGHGTAMSWSRNFDSQFGAVTLDLGWWDNATQTVKFATFLWDEEDQVYIPHPATTNDPMPGEPSGVGLIAGV
jgi:hypothetical protein